MNQNYKLQPHTCYVVRNNMIMKISLSELNDNEPFCYVKFTTTQPSNYEFVFGINNRYIHLSENKSLINYYDLEYLYAEKTKEKLIQLNKESNESK